MNRTPFSLFNESGVSIVKDGSWIGFSHEIEYADGDEIREYGWKWKERGSFHGTYVRIWIGKRVFVLSGKGFESKKKGKWALKLIIGLEFYHP